MPTSAFSASCTRLADALSSCDAVLVGAGAGLSTSSGLTYDGQRFQRLFGDFAARYGIRDMYAGPCGVWSRTSVICACRPSSSQGAPSAGERSP